MEIQSKGGAYTWSNQKSEENEICEKLDRVLSSLEWGFLFSRAIAIIDVAVASDQAPIVLLTNGMMKKVKRDFKFQSRWLIEEECSRMVEEEWTNTGGRPRRGTFRVNLRRTKVKLGKWSRENFGKNRLLANDIISTIKDLQDGPLNKEDVLKLKDLKTELTKVTKARCYPSHGEQCQLQFSISKSVSIKCTTTLPLNDALFSRNTVKLPKLDHAANTKVGSFEIWAAYQTKSNIVPGISGSFLCKDY
ncbi:hypothetical protein V6N12_058251 [Hibiscus sabdariffa]|uniref:Uncharacterized protein n=1 Tax=Hibiscus sabdariffa TaxID=183260 RepID=A0ABR2ERL5_9ROSI